MIPVLAASAGGSGFEVDGSLGPAITSGEFSLVRHDDLAVGWSASGTWIDHHDDGEVLVVVDGRIHEPLCAADESAALLASRYRERGHEFAAGVLGDFVVAILDRAHRSLLVARDPLGVRPWYQSTEGPRFAGASLEGAVAALRWVDDDVDERSAIEHLAAIWQSRGPTFHRGVETLAPGHTVEIAAGRMRLVQHHHWRLEPDLDISWDDAAERCREQLDLAVASRFHSSGPATSQLSGGLDSSSVVGTAVRLGAAELLVARLAFATPAADERSWSDAVIEHWGVPAVTGRPWVPTDPEAVALSHTLDRPVPDPHFTMFAGLDRELLAIGRPDGLTGLGGDDAFVTSSPGTLLISAVQLRRRAAMRDLVRSCGLGPRQLWTGLARPALHHLARWKGRALPGWVSDGAASSADLPTLFRARPEQVTGIAAIDERIANISSGYDASILETRAVVGDLESRRDSHPFLDPRFIEATYGLDPWWPMRCDHTRALQVAAFRDRLPAAVAERRSKAEFSEIFWGRLLDERVLENVRTGPVAGRGWLDPTGFDSLVQRAQRGMADAAIPLSRCVSLDRWLRHR